MLLSQKRHLYPIIKAKHCSLSEAEQRKGTVHHAPVIRGSKGRKENHVLQLNCHLWAWNSYISSSSETHTSPIPFVFTGERININACTEIFYRKRMWNVDKNKKKKNVQY